MVRNKQKGKGDKNNMFGWNISSSCISLFWVLQFTSVSCYHQEGRTQCQGLVRIMCASTPHFSFHLDWNGQSRTWILYHCIFSRYIRRPRREPVPSFETTSIPNTAPETIYRRTWHPESRSVMFVYLYIYLHMFIFLMTEVYSLVSQFMSWNVNNLKTK